MWMLINHRSGGGGLSRRFIIAKGTNVCSSEKQHCEEKHISNSICSMQNIGSSANSLISRKKADKISGLKPSATVPNTYKKITFFFTFVWVTGNVISHVFDTFFLFYFFFFFLNAFVTSYDKRYLLNFSLRQVTKNNKKRN